MRTACRFAERGPGRHPATRPRVPPAAHALVPSGDLGAVFVANLLKALLIRILRRIARRR